MISGQRLEVGHLLLRFTLVSAARKEYVPAGVPPYRADRARISMGRSRGLGVCNNSR